MKTRGGKRKSWRNRRRTEGGMTLLITLGFLAILMMLVLSLAITSRTERKAASASADLTRTRLLVESAFERVKAMMHSEFDGKVYPGDTFMRPESGEWAGRSYLASQGDDSSGIEEGLASNIGDLSYTPEEQLGRGVGWIPIHSSRVVGGENVDVMIGRYSYVVIDESGKIDPSAVVSSGDAEGSETRTGANVSEISLSAAGLDDDTAEDLRPDTILKGEPGKMPADSRWFSITHIAKALAPTQDEFDQMLRTLHPYSYDEEKFWRDADNDGEWDEGEDAERLNINDAPTLEEIYNVFVGPKRAGDVEEAGEDDSAWLKEVSNDPWFQDWRDVAFAHLSEPLRTAKARQLVAAQVAANIVDYGDLDSVPTQVYLDTGGNIHEGTYAGAFNIHGSEKTWGVSEIALTVEADQIEVPAEEAEEEDEADDIVDFEIDNGSVVPSETCRATVTVLGCQVGCYYNTTPPQFLYWVPTTVQIQVGGDSYEPWGDWTKAVNGDVNDGDNPRTFELPDTYAAGTPVSISSKYYTKRSLNYSGTQNSHWSLYRTVDSRPGNARVIVLRDGDDVPDIACVWNQNNLAYYVDNYVVDDKVCLDPNQAIYLFECASDLSSATAADYQDMIALVTLLPVDAEEAAEEAEEAAAEEAAATYDFDIADGQTIPTGNFFLNVTCLGSSLFNWGYQQPATVKVKVGDTWYEPFGPYSQPVDGNVGDNNNPRSYDFPDAFPADSPVSIQVEFWKKISTRYSGNRNSHWTESRTVYSANPSHFCRTRVLRNGDPVPEVPGFQNQQNVEYYVQDYVQGDSMVMEEDQAIYLFEHTSNLDGSGADFQDCVMLVTMVDEREVIGVNDPVEAEEDDGSEDDPPEEGTGESLRFRLGVKGEIFYPYASNAHESYPPGEMIVTCTAVVDCASGASETITLTDSINMTQVANVDGGTALYSADFDYGEWVEIPNAFNLDVTPAETWYTVSLLQIDNIRLKDSGGNVVDSFPANGTFFCNWSQEGTSEADSSFHVSARSYDPLMNDRASADADFSSFWSVYPDTESLAEGQEDTVADIGALTHGGYAGVDYGDIDVKNSAIDRLGELGRVHSYRPRRSLRLWAASSSDVAGNDTAILDLFRTGPGLRRRGKVNINTLQPAVLEALFADATEQSVSSVVDAILDARADGQVFTNIGQVFALPNVSGSNRQQDAVEEAAVGRIAELITCRQNYFTVLACAQSIKDVAGLQYRNEGEETPRTAQYGQLDVKCDSDGNVVRYIDRIIAEQKVRAVIYRDGFSNEMRVERFEYLNE